MSDAGLYQFPKCSRFALGVALILVVCFGLTSCGVTAIQNSAGQGTSHAITLTWNASASTVSGYVVYRATDAAGPFIPVKTTLAATTQYTDTNVVAGQTYFYEVTAYDSANVESVRSNMVWGTVPAP